MTSSTSSEYYMQMCLSGIARAVQRVDHELSIQRFARQGKYFALFVVELNPADGERSGKVSVKQPPRSTTYSWTMA